MIEKKNEGADTNIGAITDALIICIGRPLRWLSFNATIQNIGIRTLWLSLNVYDKAQSDE